MCGLVVSLILGVFSGPFVRSMLNTKSTAVLSLLLPRTWRVSSACRGENLCSKRVLYTFACSYGGVQKPQLASPFPFRTKAPPRSKFTRVQANASHTMEQETGTLLPGRRFVFYFSRIMYFKQKV